MRNILLVEPDYRSKFPPLGLMRLATYHRGRGDAVTFVRGKAIAARQLHWDRVYVSSLFTWELPRTVETVKYYERSVAKESDVYVGGVGATLFPEYLKSRVGSTLLTGLLDGGGELDPLSPPLSNLVPDYSLLDTLEYPYGPKDAYFVKITTGCIRKCKFCAVPILEPKFAFSNALKAQLARVHASHGEKQNLVVMDNNIMGVDEFPAIVQEIIDAGFGKGSKRNGRRRTVDFNQGLDCRLIDDEKAKLLGSMNIDPVRLAFDHDGIENPYRAAITKLAGNGLDEFTNYLLFNFVDKPESLYKRMEINMDLGEKLNVAVTAFPMRFVPMDDINKRHISKGWKWRQLRGMQCILLATRGVVSPNPTFFHHAFGSSVAEFEEIICMPDRYIIWRKAFENQGAADWKKEFRALSIDSKTEFLDLLQALNKLRGKARQDAVTSNSKFRSLLEHYYPGGKTPANKAPEVDLEIQGLATGYDYSTRPLSEAVADWTSSSVVEADAGRDLLLPTSE